MTNFVKKKIHMKERFQLKKYRFSEKIRQQKKLKLFMEDPTLVLYQKLRRNQQKIKSEVRADDILRRAADTSKENIVNNFTKLLFEKKKYFNWFLANELLFSTKNTDVLDFPEIKIEEKDNDFEINGENLKKFANTKGKNKLDVFTFSIIPSNYMFFITEKSRETFLEFLFAQEKELLKSISRVIFVTPEFTNFVHCAFSPILSAQNITEEVIKTQIEAKINKCPILVYDFLKRCKEQEYDATEMLIDCWIEPMCQCVKKSFSKLSAYRMIEFFETSNNPDRDCSIVKNALSRHASSIVETIINKAPKEFKADPLSNITLEELEAINNQTVYSQLDILVNNDDKEIGKGFFQDLLIKNFTKYSSVMKIVPTNCVEGMLPQATMVESKESSLRHLLKYSDSLPVQPLIKRDSITDILYDLCVKRGSIATLPQRKKDFEAIKLSNINRIVNSVFVDREKPRKVLTNLSSAENVIKTELKNTKSSITLVEKLSSLLKDKKISEKYKNMVGLHNYKSDAKSEKYKLYDMMHYEIISKGREQFDKIFFSEEIAAGFNEIYRQAINLADNPLKIFILINDAYNDTLEKIPKIAEADYLSFFVSMLINDGCSCYITRSAFLFQTMFEEDKITLKDDFKFITDIYDVPVQIIANIITLMGVLPFYDNYQNTKNKGELPLNDIIP